MKSLSNFRTVLAIVVILFHSIPIYGQFGKESYDHDTTAKYGLSEIQFVGAGDLQFSAYEGEDVAATTGLGALFWRIWPSSEFQSGDPVKMIPGMELQMAIQINVVSTVDTLRAIYDNNLLANQRTFGSFLLSPVGSGPSTMINSLWYFKPYSYDGVTGVTKRGIRGIPIFDGIELNIAGASRAWLYNQDQTIHVAVLSWRAGFFHEFMPENDRRKKGYSIRLGVNYAGRSIQGDLGRQREIRKMLLSNVERNYHGLEFVLAARFKNIQAEASLPWLHIGANNSRAVSGLSGVQFNTTISFVGGFSLDLTDGR